MRMPKSSLGVETMDTTARAQDSSPPSISTIGEDLTITGNVTSKGELHVNGRVQGDVHCAALVLGENAQVEGSVVAQDVMVRGRLIGSVRALRVVLQSTAYVEGNLFHKSLFLEQGTHFEGESRPSNDPLSIPEIHADLSGVSPAREDQQYGKITAAFACGTVGERSRGSPGTNTLSELQLSRLLDRRNALTRAARCGS